MTSFLLFHEYFPALPRADVDAYVYERTAPLRLCHLISTFTATEILPFLIGISTKSAFCVCFSSARNSTSRAHLLSRCLCVVLNACGLRRHQHCEVGRAFFMVSLLLIDPAVTLTAGRFLCVARDSFWYRCTARGNDTTCRLMVWLYVETNI